MEKIHKKRRYKKWLIENKKDTLGKHRNIYYESKKKNPLSVSPEFLICNGFTKKESDEEYYESVLNSNEPSTTIYVYSDSIEMTVGSSIGQKLNIKTDNELSEFIQIMQRILS